MTPRFEYGPNDPCLAQTKHRPAGVVSTATWKRGRDTQRFLPQSLPTSPLDKHVFSCVTRRTVRTYVLSPRGSPCTAGRCRSGAVAATRLATKLAAAGQVEDALDGVRGPGDRQGDPELVRALADREQSSKPGRIRNADARQVQHQHTTLPIPLGRSAATLLAARAVVRRCPQTTASSNHRQHGQSRHLRPRRRDVRRAARPRRSRTHARARARIVPRWAASRRDGGRGR